MSFILGQKKEMTQIFDGDGRVRPVTAVKAGPMIVVCVKNLEKDGYGAVQFGYGSKNPKNVKKPQKGHLSKITISKEGGSPAPAGFQDLTSIRWMREFRSEEADKFKEGDIVDASVFKEGDKIKVRAVSKGKGFQGVVKRYGFGGGPRSHGQKHSEREPGSIGSTGPQRVLKGKKMPGRMGGDKVTVRNLEVLKVEAGKNIIFVSGAVPGRRGTLIEIRSAE